MTRKAIGVVVIAPSSRRSPDSGSRARHSHRSVLPGRAQMDDALATPTPAGAWHDSRAACRSTHRCEDGSGDARLCRRRFVRSASCGLMKRVSPTST
jgi:hypothetical protein